ncbi:type II toxin-antitoxin system CcdA family antitoxin [Parvibaculum sp.]|uniref:type II toxin-antitoxin system CcdA family antitoxin n=1 Tax=Parvibaculum sp. TaxID=2024848 RepID=UPI0025DDC2B6|nr:type II toxin-antitoxin system CcdA family antitoxin [Parvibaculum sp.]
MTRIDHAHKMMRMAKKAVNLSVDANLLTHARELNINLSALLEGALREEARKRWREENREAIEAYNERIREYGVWSDGLRRF